MLSTLKVFWRYWLITVLNNALHDACTFPLLYKIVRQESSSWWSLLFFPFACSIQARCIANNMTMDTDCWSTNTDGTALQDQHDSIGSITSSTYSVTPVGSLHQKENNKPKSLDERDVETIREPISKEGIRNPGWLTVLGTFIINFYTWGVLVSWGIFQVL